MTAANTSLAAVTLRAARTRAILASRRVGDAWARAVRCNAPARSSPPAAHVDYYAAEADRLAAERDLERLSPDPAAELAALDAAIAGNTA